jgi:type II secretory pathway pseudopilin PulG
MANLSEKKYKKPLKQKGFSLIELSVIISVAASATIGFLSWTQPKNIDDARKATITRESMKVISNAIEAFVVEKGRLPCPADQLMRIDNTSASGTDYYVNDYGVEDLDTSDTLINGTKTLGVDCPNSNGAVPVYSLGLGKSYMTDGWGRRFTYQVATTLCGADAGIAGNVGDDPAADMTSRRKGCTKYSYATGTGNITVTDGSLNLTTTASYVLVSHGANGKGAYLPSGSQLANGTGNELENSNTNTTFVKAVNSSSFDDIVMFKTKTQVNRLNDSQDIKQVSIAECEANSTALKNITLTSGDEMTNTITTHLHGTYNTGQKVALGIMMAYQSLCVKYYGATTGTGANAGWSGAQCPGNNNTAVNGKTYVAASNSCYCKSNLWDGNCIKPLPTDTANLTFWLDASDSTTVFTAANCTGAVVNGSLVMCWQDKSTNAAHATNAVADATRPSYVTSAQNSLSIVRFDGTDDYLATASLAGSTFFSAAEATVFLIAGSTNSSGNRGPIGFDATSNTNRFLIVSQGSYFYRFDYPNSTTGLLRAVTNQANIWNVATFEKTTTTQYIYINGTLDISQANALSLTTATAAKMYIGAGGNGASTPGNYILGDIGEIAIYSRGLTDIERVLLQQYFGDKWAITIN